MERPCGHDPIRPAAFAKLYLEIHFYSSFSPLSVPCRPLVALSGTLSHLSPTCLSRVIVSAAHLPAVASLIRPFDSSCSPQVHWDHVDRYTRQPLREAPFYLASSRYAVYTFFFFLFYFFVTFRVQINQDVGLGNSLSAGL